MKTAILITAITLSAPALKDKPRNDSIVGDWVVVEGFLGGRAIDYSQSEIRWIFKSDGSRSILLDGKTAFSGRYTFDAIKSPGTIDLDAKAVYLCIYKIDGDTLTMTVGRENAKRPTEFASPIDSDWALYVFKRAKPKD